MIEVTDIMAVNKGSLKCTCSVHIIPWKLTLHDVKVFEKGQNKWLGMPAKTYTNASGETSYVELITFDSEGVKNRFRGQIMEAVDKFIEGNPEMKGEDVVKETDDLPF